MSQPAVQPQKRIRLDESGAAATTDESGVAADVDAIVRECLAEGIFKVNSNIKPESDLSDLVNKALHLFELMNFLSTITDMLVEYEVNEPIMKIQGVLMSVTMYYEVHYYIVMRNSGSVFEILDMQRAMPFLKKLNYTSFNNGDFSKHNTNPMHELSDADARPYVEKHWDLISKLFEMARFIDDNAGLVVDNSNFSYDMVLVKVTKEDGSIVYISITNTCGYRGLIYKIIDEEEEKYLDEEWNIMEISYDDK